MVHAVALFYTLQIPRENRFGMQTYLIRSASLCLWFLVALLDSRCLALQDTSQRDDQWHQWRGPRATGVAPCARPPVTWSESANVAWKVPVAGEGISTPVVWQDRVFLLTAVPTDRVSDHPPAADPRAMTRPPENIFQFRVMCLDLNTGQTIWEDVCTELVPHEGRHQTSAYAAASPMTDGQRLIVPFGSFGIFSYTLDGKQEWSIDLGDMHTRRGWGEATSAVLVDDLVIMNWDNEDESFLYALDAARGEIRWQVARDEPTTWATPLIIERDGHKQVVTNGTNSIAGYDLQTGKSLWTAPGTTLNAIPSPVEFGDSVICMAGYQGNRAVSVTIGADGDVEQDWELQKGTPYVPSPLLSENRLYFTQSNKAILHCVDAGTGEYFYEPRRLDSLENLYGSPMAANGLVYLVDRDGTAIVFRDSEQFEVVAINRLDDAFDASPVAVGSKLLLRGRKSLYCIEQK